MGQRIRILTTRAADRTWHGSVITPDHPEISVEPQAGRSESEGTELRCRLQYAGGSRSLQNRQTMSGLRAVMLRA